MTPSDDSDATPRLDLEAIRDRAYACERYYLSPLGEIVVKDDVPMLLAEIERLQHAYAER